MHRCNICKVLLDDEWLLDIHKEIHHNNTNNVEEDNDELDEIYQMLSQHQQEQNLQNTRNEEELEKMLAEQQEEQNLVNNMNEEELEEIDQMLAQHQQEDFENNTNEEQLEEMLDQQQELRPSVINYAPGPSFNVELHARALPGRVVTHFKINNAKLKLEEFVSKAKGLVTKTLKNELKRLNFIKFGLLLDAMFTNVQNETSPRGFITKNKTIMLVTDIESVVDECFEEILTKLQEHEGRGSGWSLLSIEGLDLRVHKHGYGMRGSSYLPLPKKIKDTLSCINVQNDDVECFKYSMLAKYVHNHPERPSRAYETVEHKYNFQGLTYPVKIQDASKFEKKNPLTSVNIFGLDSSNNVYPLRITPTERRDHTDLLLITKVSKFLKESDSAEEAPYFEQNLYRAEVREDEDVHHAIITVTAENHDEAPSVRYEITGGNVGEVFAIDADTGEVTLAGPLDYENRKQYSLQLLVSDGESSSFATLIVRVLDVNDNPPVFEKSSYRTQITEEDDRNIPKKILQVNVTDGDKDRPRDVVYFLAGPGVDTDDPSNAQFSINSTTGEIYVLKPLDRDLPHGRSQWRFTVFGQDEGGQGLVGYADIQVNLKDINDNAPYFPEPLCYANVTENGTAGLLVIVMSAIDYDDPDEGGNAKLVYTIEKNVLDELSGAAIFSIEPSTGEVRTAVCCLDREKTPEYTLQVVAMDGGGLKGTGTVSILVSDINDVSPVFTKDKWITEVFEGVESLYNSILTVAVRDRDETNDFYYQVVDGSGYGTDMFSMVRNADGTGSLRVVKALDYEDPLQRRGLRFKIQVNDQVNDQGPNGTAEDSHISHSWVMVRVKDINDNPPLLDQGEARVSLKEDVRVGTLVETFTARDPDQGGEGRVVFALDRISDPGRHFKVSPEGRVTIQRPLDREAIPVHKLVVLATDEGEPQLTATALLTVTVIDVNDHAPSLLKEYTPVVTENSSPRVVVELFAQDLDEHSDGHGPPYTFSLDPSVDPSVSRVFRVQTNPKGDNERGVAVVSTLAALDREKQKEYLLPIVIQDSGRPPMVGTSTLTVTVGDINDNPMTPGSTHITAYKLEGRESEMVVGRVYATDLDDWDLPDKTFSWASTPESHFHLDLDTGGITMKSDTPEGEYHMRFVVRDTRRKESVESDVTVTVRTITRHAMANSQSITLLGITDRNFISSVNASASPLDVFKEIIAQVLNTSTNLVEVFHVKTDNRFPPQTDVRFSVRDHSQYFKPVRLSGLLLMHRQMVEQGLGVRVSRVGPDQCLSEGSASPECEISCHPSLSIPSGLPTSLNDVVVANTSGLAFPHFNTSVQCACSARDFKLPETCRSKPCLNRGSCLDTRHGPVCTCLPNYDGPRCQLVSRGFHGSGYAWYPGLEACNNSHLSLEFLASSNDGSLLYNGPIAPPSEQQDLLKDFIALELIEGTVQLLIDMGSGTVNLTLPTKVNDGEWHRIDVVWDTEEVKLVVDLCKSHPLDSSEHFWTTSSSSDCMSSSLFPLFSSQLNLDTPLQLGGALTLGMDPKQYGWEVAPRLQSFDGCIRNVLYNGELLDLGSPALWHDSEEGCPHSRPRCSESCSAWSSCEASLTTARCVCHSGYAGLSCSVPTVPTTFLPGGFVKYSLSLQPDPRHTLLQLRFRTRRPVGELFRLMDQHHKEYIILEISGSILQVRMNLDGDRPLETTVSLSHVRVDDGRWHGAKVLRHGSSLILQVDGGEGRRYNESFHFKGHQLLFIDKQEGVYAGGPTDYIGIKVNFAMASFEQGCLDDIRLNGRHLPLPPSSNSSQWGQAPVFRGVESHCHSRSVCAEVQCPETFVCQDIWNDYVCTCGVNQVATADGKACAARSECHSSPCLNGGICQDGGPGQQYRCLCPDSYTGQRCELAHERQTLKLGYPALFTIVGCLLLILLLVVLFVSYTRRRDSHIKKPAEDDVRENIIRYYDDGGGEEDLRGVDLLPLKVPTQAIISDSGPGTKPQVPELIEETSIDVRAEGCRRRIDVDVEICLPPSDDLRTYAFEGSCESPTGSLSSLDLDSEEKEDGQRLVLGPRFQNLVEIYSSKLEHGQLEDAKM